MKIIMLAISLLLMTACAPNSKLITQDGNDELAVKSENDKLCENHKNDFEYFRVAFDKEHSEICSTGCAYTPSMNKNSDTMERVAGLYYLMNCDSEHGRL
ncbi:MAG: hypothetical protein M0R33_05845 [Methylomonas sp.]|uniref:hypothetical protein n=1 Tax=Methylomonas sp. TaxID=418 RepID=UPI0025EC990E|nr:hypothetical protein [Methylomonas sp.]MCK9605958.1 hypothetical protein [Methylomonas sp.]